jgi:hypothetical protein
MKKKAMLTILLIFVMSSVLTAAAPTKTNLARLEISNKTDGEVQVTLSGGGYYYYLIVDPNTTKTFTIEREVYNERIYACNQVEYGELDATSNAKLVIRKCENPDVVSLTIMNKTSELVELSLIRTDKFHHLRVDPHTTKTFTLTPELFYQNTFSCGKSMDGYLDMESSVRLVFTGCGEPAPNKGEPTQEKVHIDDSPSDTVYWRYFNWE